MPSGGSGVCFCDSIYCVMLDIQLFFCMLYVFSPKFSDGFLGVLHYKQSDLLSLRDTHKPEGVVILQWFVSL